MKTGRRNVVAGLMGVGVMAGWPALAGAAAGRKPAPAGVPPVAIPQIQGPIPATPASAPFTAWAKNDDPMAVEAARRGYTMQEYFISGTVEGRPYRTTLLIRRPADPAKFSGTVAFETLHGGGLGVVWPKFWDALSRRGHGYAMVVSQPYPLEQVTKKAAPARYADLIIPPQTRPYSGNGGFAPSSLATMGPVLADAARTTVIKDTLTSYDIIAQAGALLKTDSRLFGKPAKHLVMSGTSQTGWHTLGFLMEAHDAARMKDGSYVFDGYMPQGAYADVPVGPVGVPVFLVINEGEMLEGKPQPFRRADSDGSADQFRLYELAASAHGETRGQFNMANRLEGLAMDPKVRKETMVVSGAGSLGSAVPSQYPISMVKAALFIDLIDWVSKGVTPPRAPRIAMGTDNRPLKDSYGNTVGGVRSSYLDAPTAKYVGWGIMTQDTFDPARLRALYGNEAGYVAAVEKSTKRMVAARYLLPEDAAALVAEAKQFSFTAKPAGTAG